MSCLACGDFPAIGNNVLCSECMEAATVEISISNKDTITHVMQTPNSQKDEACQTSSPANTGVVSLEQSPTTMESQSTQEKVCPLCNTSFLDKGRFCQDCESDMVTCLAIDDEFNQRLSSSSGAKRKLDFGSDAAVPVITTKDSSALEITFTQQIESTSPESALVTPTSSQIGEIMEDEKAREAPRKKGYCIDCDYRLPAKEDWKIRCLRCYSKYMKNQRRENKGKDKTKESPGSCQLCSNPTTKSSFKTCLKCFKEQKLIEKSHSEPPIYLHKVILTPEFKKLPPAQRARERQPLTCMDCGYFLDQQWKFQCGSCYHRAPYRRPQTATSSSTYRSIYKKARN